MRGAQLLVVPNNYSNYQSLQDNLWKKLILSYTEPRFDYINLFIIDFACEPKSESDFYYFNTLDIARLDEALVSFLVDQVFEFLVRWQC